MSTASGNPPSPDERLAAIESLDDLVVSLDRELRITSWNVAAERLMDRPAPTALGAAIMTMIAPGLRLDISHLFERALASDPIPRQEMTMMRQDGSEVVLSIAIAPVGVSGGRASALVLLGHDIGEQQRLQFQLLRSKRMESTGQLAGGVAHEFNNILTAILALSEFAVRGLPADAPSRSDIDQIREQATKGARLVRHLLAFSRRQFLRTESTHLGPVLQELEPLLQRLISERIFIATDVAPGTPAVEIDRAQMELVLIELISNASDAMDAGGTLTVDVRPIEIASHTSLPPGAYVQVTLQDTGPGVDPASRERVFEPFFTTKGEGHTGLGLAMVEGVILQHGGSIGMDSVPGEGTRVTLLLPASRREASAPLVTTSPLEVTGEANETILVVEDEATVRNVVVRSLRSRGYEVLEAKDGEDALLVAERHNAPVHLVVTDVVMPHMNGTELFHHLRRWYPRMRVLFISGYARSAIPPEAFEEGKGAAFLAKPFTIEQLLNEVRQLIQSPRKAEAGV
jgi:two-component system, cell cycle sensor histidine kinase and response regulator CckA